MCGGDGKSRIEAGKACPACEGSGKWAWAPAAVQPYRYEPPAEYLMDDAVNEFKAAQALKDELLKPDPESCACDSCINACKSKPGWFLPGEAQKVADYLGVTMEDLFEDKLAVDFFLDMPSDVFVLSPAIRNGLTGAMFDYDPKGTCVFLEGNSCSIHAVKPFECRQYLHDNQKQVEFRHRAIAEAWRTQQDEVLKLYPYPCVPERSGFWFGF